MTLDSTTSRVQYTQSGTTTEWPVTFKFLDAEDLIVITTVAGVDTTLVLDTDYTVDGAGDDSGGTVTIDPAVAAGTKVTIYRVVDLDQPTELTTAGGWFPKVHETVFDRLTMQIQQVQEGVDRAVKTGITSTETPDNIMADLYAARDAAATSASDASGFADAAATSASDASGFADAAQGHANTAAGYVTEAEGFADDAEQSALDAVAAVSGLDARVDQLEIDLPALETAVGDKLDKDENINLGASYTIVGNETAIDFGSTEDPIPAGVKRITVMFNGVSTSGTSKVIMQIGVSDPPEITGYVGGCAQAGNYASGAFATTTGMLLLADTAASLLFTGLCELSLIGGNTWSYKTNAYRNDGMASVGVYTKSISGYLGMIRITTVNGTDQFDAGTINISWEF